jgi:ABC-type multidrug transport system ATPase subunit
MLDEPSLGLAPLIVRDILAIVRTLRDDGVSILLVEQNARAALETSDHGYVLETGEIAFAGASDQLAGDPRVQATYLGGGPTMTPLNHDASRGGDRTADRRTRRASRYRHCLPSARPSASATAHVSTSPARSGAMPMLRAKRRASARR